MKATSTLVCGFFISVFIAGCGHNNDPKWDKEFFGGRDRHQKWNVLQDDIAKADYEYYFYDDWTLRNSGNGKAPLDGMRIHFDESKNASSRDSTGFVVVQLHMLAQLDRVEQKVDAINRFFFARGANRVLVTGLRGIGTSVYSDKNKTQQVAASDR